jgi:hypothetical protein
MPFSVVSLGNRKYTEKLWGMQGKNNNFFAEDFAPASGAGRRGILLSECLRGE